MIKYPKSLAILGTVLLYIQAAHGQLVLGGQVFVDDFKPTPTHMLTGTVFDPSGAPVAGVIMDTLPAMSSAGTPITTDAKGKYGLPWQMSPLASIFAMTDSLLARDVKHNLVATHLVDERTDTVDLHLQPGLTISFQVEDTAGNPVNHAVAQLRVFYANSSALISNQPPEGNAKERNRIEFNALPQDYHYKGWAQADGYGRAPLSFPSDLHTNRIDLGVVKLKKANLKVAGRVVRSDGVAVGQLMVTLNGEEQPTSAIQADEHGYFTFDACEGPLTLTTSYSAIEREMGQLKTTGGDTNAVVKLKPMEDASAPANRAFQSLLPGG
jgi:hypothetical protein